MNILSLFDGISCARIALNRSGIKVTNYFAAEIDKYAIKVSKHNYPDIIQIGDVKNISYKDGKLKTENGDFEIKIDLVVGGSPCQGFSLCGQKLAFDDPRSKLYFEFERILKEVNPKFWMLENVKMKKEHKEIITKRLGVEPILINSALVSAQNRQRLYWTNIPDIKQPEDKKITLNDIVLDNVENKYYIKYGRAEWLKKYGEIKEKNGYIAFNPNKAKCLTARFEPSWNTTYIVQYPHGANYGGIKSENGKCPTLTISSWQYNNILIDEGVVRRLTPIECERLQTICDNYTSCVSDSQRYKQLGNCWNIDTVVHIFKKINECSRKKT